MAKKATPAASKKTSAAAGAGDSHPAYKGMLHHATR